MRWTPLPKGQFTGIDWSRPGATTGFDPYLVWAEADLFAGYGLTKPPRWMPLLMELAPGADVAALAAATSPSWLRIPPVYLSRHAPRGLRYCTVRVRPAFFRELAHNQALKALVNRFELGLPVGRRTGDELPEAWHEAGPENAELLGGKVMGFIDGGLAFANAAFLREDKTRIKYFWRQDEQGKGITPPDMGYGHQLKASDIDRSMRDNTYGGLVDETAVYAHFEMGMELNKQLNHGTHVLDIAAGPRTVLAQIAGVPPHLNAPPTWALADDDASRCDIVAVQLDWDTVVDTSGGSMNVHIMDGLMYILSRCKPSAKIAVNLSWGTLAGPHDGTSVLEAAMDQLLQIKSDHLAIALPVSNNYQGRTHANMTLPARGRTTLHWRGQPGDASQNFLELWLPEGAHAIGIRLTPPGQASLPVIHWGESGTWNSGSGQPICALIYPRSVATGLNGTCALLAVSPTHSFDVSVSTAPSGVWEVELVNEGSTPVTLDAYVERDDQIVGVPTAALSSRTLKTASMTPAATRMQWVDHPDNPSLIRRSGSFNSIATGARTVSVGGKRISDGSWALYSPQEPDPDASRPERPGVVKVPDTRAPSDENSILLGLKAAGTRSGGVARLVGTSDAAPQVTRKILNGM
jgi:hypothetical protein